MYSSIRRIILLILLLGSFFPVPVSAQKIMKDLNVHEIYGTTKFQGKSLRSIKWVKEKEDVTGFTYLTTDDSTNLTNIWFFDIRSDSARLFIDASTLIQKPGDPPYPIENYLLSPDFSKILFTGKLTARTTKTGGDFFIYDVKSREFKELPAGNGVKSNAQFSPDGKKIGFVESNNIIVFDLPTGREVQLTHDGAEHIFNGRFDWVYEEEFSIIDGWQWSPDGKYIAYWQLDENRVPKHILWDFGPQHAEPRETRYPQPGDSNSVVKIGIVSLETKNNTWADIGTETDIYVPRIAWMPDGKSLFIQRLNRAQNELDLLAVDPETGSARTIFSEKENAWIDISDDLAFIGSTHQFIWSSERDGFTHLYLYALDGSPIRQLTEGEWDVEQLKGVDEKNKLVYFTAGKKSPIEKHLYVTGLDGSGLRQLTGERGTHIIDLSPDARYYIDKHSTVVHPPRQLLCKTDGSPVRVLEDNPLQVLHEYALGGVEFFMFRTSDGTDLNCSIIKPPDFDSTRKYPVLISVYGGPGSQNVEDKWGGSQYLWHQMLAQKGYIIVSVDNRGTGFRGKAFKQIVNRNLGKWEANDYIETALYLGSLPFIDRNRIGIWGWSYGGYATLMAMCLGADYFKTGIAVAPVTHWMYYDNIYTERYMGTPKNNPKGYERSAPINSASLMKGNLLIVHGTGDDNVHWQNTITMVDSLIAANKQFETAFYPGRDHSIRGGVTREHLFNRITEFILGNL